MFNKQHKTLSISLLIAGCLALSFVIQQFQKNKATTPPETIQTEVIKNVTEPKTTVQVAEQSPYSCLGKTRCTEFSSCEEARFHLSHCENLALDKDRDGVPCEGTLCQNQ